MLAKFQVFSSHVWLVVTTTVDSTGIEHLSYQMRKFWKTCFRPGYLKQNRGAKLQK